MLGQFVDVDSDCNLSMSECRVDTVDTEDRLTMDYSSVQCRHIGQSATGDSTGVSVLCGCLLDIGSPALNTQDTALGRRTNKYLSPHVLYLRGYFQTFSEASEIECRLPRHCTIDIINMTQAMIKDQSNQT